MGSKLKAIGAITTVLGGTTVGIKALIKPNPTSLPALSDTNYGSSNDNFHQIGGGISTDSLRDTNLDNNFHQTTQDNPHLDTQGSQNSQEITLPQTKWSEFQSVSYNPIAWTHDVNYSETEREEKRKEAREIFRRLNDYTFKFFGPCGWGTGWILDFHLPENNEKYPTTWYIATNAHVAWRFRFSSNDYKQELPIYHGQTKRFREKNAEAFNSLRNFQGELRNNCDSVDTLGYFDISLSKQATGAERHDDIGMIARNQIEEPKLFFSAFNYMNRQKTPEAQSNHYSDFVVIEIKFKSEEIAKTVTNDFYNKYKDKPDNELINVLGEAVENKYDTREKLWNAQDNYYLLAYPDGAVNKWVYTTNFNPYTGIASQLDGDIWDWNTNGNKTRPKGFVNARNVSKGSDIIKKFKWQGEIYTELGHYYKLKFQGLKGGSSGGLFVDGRGVALGLNSMGQGETTWSTPLRSDGVTFKEGNLETKTPKYDLILGTEGQRKSYKQQVEDYGKKTWLSQKPQWNRNSVSLAQAK